MIVSYLFLTVFSVISWKYQVVFQNNPAVRFTALTFVSMITSA